VRIGASFSVGGDMPDWGMLAQNVYMARGLLKHVGMSAARTFYRERLSAILHPDAFSSTGAPLSKRGRRMVSYSVTGDNRAVIIRSYPLNVLRRGPGPRSAKRTEGEKIFRSFAASFDATPAAKEALDTLLSYSLGKQREAAGSTGEEWATRLRKTRTNGANKL
jgi:hypothetical protein